MIPDGMGVRALREVLSVVVLGLVLLSLGIAAVGCGRSQSVSAEFVGVDHPKGSIQSGSQAEVIVSIKNTGTGYHTFWVGYSVQTPPESGTMFPRVQWTWTPERSRMSKNSPRSR